MQKSEIKEFLDEKVNQYNAPSFIASDPISVPKQFSNKEDVEIAAYLAATISWGQRKAILKSAENILKIMAYEPYAYVLDGDFRNVPDGVVYRTFNSEDLLYFFKALNHIYKVQGGLEKVFTEGYIKNRSVKDAIAHFRNVFTSFEESGRSGKHLANVSKGSSAKRINMFLRWMVRCDEGKVDFGIWKGIDTADLMLPLDVHTGNVGRKLGLLKRKQNDWQAVEEITLRLKDFDAKDPIKYDYALFGLGVFEKF